MITETLESERLHITCLVAQCAMSSLKMPHKTSRRIRRPQVVQSPMLRSRLPVGIDETFDLQDHLDELTGSQGDYKKCTHTSNIGDRVTGTSY